MSNFIRRNKDNFIFILILLVVFVIFYVPVPGYYLDEPGGLVNLDGVVNVIDSHEISGSYNLTYVLESKATTANLIYAQFNSQYDIITVDELKNDNETIEEANKRSELSLSESESMATLVAYNRAHRDLDIKAIKIYVYVVDPDAKTDLKINDQIIKIDGITINEPADVTNLLANKKVGDTLTFEVINNDTTYQRTATLSDYDGEMLIGIAYRVIYEFNNSEVTFTFDDSPSGSSGGLMMSLMIYNQLTGDISHGLKIAGTGTIDQDGNVGEIAGVKYKIIGAYQQGIDVFFVPIANYEEAKSVIEAYNYDLKLVSVQTIDDAIDYLNSLD